MTHRTQRLRDPVHGLIVFEKDDALAQLAWRLINTPEFQRLRRIKQLGVSEFVFPSAVHTRFAHSIGVFHTARELVQIIKRESNGSRPFDEGRADVATIAALLHDLGHGPFSHTFEGVQSSRGVRKRHEKWTADIIRSGDGAIRPLLEARRAGLTEEVASLVAAEDPTDIYHAVVSSSFDADRLDYLRRDRLMTGTGAGAIDFDWLMEHVRVADIVSDAPERAAGDDASKVAAFCLDPKALPAAEQFLLSRYALHEQVYLHKTTRCIETMIGKLLRRIATAAEDADTAPSRTGLQADHVLLRFFALDGDTLDNYLALDDLAIAGSLEKMQRGGDPAIADLAGRLRERRLYKTLDIGRFGSDLGKQRQAVRRIDLAFEEKLESGAVIKDETASVGIYTPVGGDEDRTHNKLHILDAGRPREISEMSKMIETLAIKRQFTRYYFAESSDRDAAVEEGR
ncbi:MAG: HD domain-containing protein [Alphaproteobacteria bacterium]|nr:HD domain-containing protein [Alphaproteobacteria bacterium]